MELRTPPSMASAISIIAYDWWIVSVDSEFTQEIPKYPAYRDPIPVADVVYRKKGVFNEERIVSINAIRHMDDTIGVVYQTAKQLKYTTSTDNSGSIFSTPIVISDLSQSESSFGCGALHSIGITLILGNPAVVYTQGTDAVNDVYYVRASDSTGTAWNSPVFVQASHPTRGVVRIQPRPPYDDVAYANPAVLGKDYPEILFTNTTSIPKLAYGSADFNTPTWSVDTSMNVAGYSVDLGLYLNTTLVAWNDNTKSDEYQNRTYVFIRRESDNAPYFFRRTQNNLTWLTNSFATEIMKSYGRIIGIPTTVPATGSLLISRTIQIPMTIWQAFNQEVIYTRTMGLDLSGNPFARVTGEPVISIPAPVTAPNITLGEFNGLVSNYFTSGETVSLCYISLDDLFFCNQELFTFEVGVQNKVNTGLIDNYACLTDTQYFTIPWLVFQEYNNSVYTMVPTSITTRLGVQYRIRMNPPLLSGSGYSLTTNLLNGSETTVQFPSRASRVDDFYKGDYVWIYNINVDEIPSPFHMFDDVRQITSYSGTNRTATVFPPFSGDLGTLAIPPLTNLVNWEILQVSSDNFFPYVFDGSAQEMQCWKIRLVRLNLPNVELKNATGGLLSSYPYVFVKLVNTTAQNRLVLFSNNPHSFSATFRIPISFIVSPLQSGFLPLYGIGEQSIRFKPNDNFEFSVTMPDGTLFESVFVDPSPPFPVIADIQISALFECVRVMAE
jgi:hypothetical protein